MPNNILQKDVQENGCFTGVGVPWVAKMKYASLRKKRM